MPFLAPVVGAVVSAVGAVGSFIGGLGFIGKAIIGIGLNIAAAAIQKRMAKKANAEASGVILQKQYGDDLPRMVAMGLVGIAGHDVFINTHGPSNAGLANVFALSDYPIDGLSRVWINGKIATLDFDNPLDGAWPVTSHGFTNLAWIELKDGTQSAADTSLVAVANPANRWTSDHIGEGIAYVITWLAYNDEKMNTLPDVFYEIRGAKLYDWRKDTTAGGSGSHRWNTPSTHEFTENPIVMAYNYLRGISYNGDLFCGMQVPASDLPLSKWTTAANICEETVSGEDRYRCSVVVDCTAEHGDNLEGFMKACGGMLVIGVDGIWPLVGSDDASVATITDDDFIKTEPVRFRAKRSMSELVNTVSGSYIEPDELWSPLGYPTRVSSSHVTVDRRTRDVQIDFGTVPSRRQATQLASQALKENRYEATAEGTLRPRWRVLEAGDKVEWESARYGDAYFRAGSRSLVSLESDGPRNVRLSLQETAGDIYDDTDVPAVVVPVPPGEPVYANSAEDFTAVYALVSDGRQAIRAQWSAFTDETVTGTDLEWWPLDDTDSVFSKSVAKDVLVATLTEGILPEKTYAVRHRLITAPSRTVIWTTPIDVEIPAAPPADFLVFWENLQAGVRNVLAQIKGLADQNASRIEELARDVALGQGSSEEQLVAAVQTQEALAVAVLTLSATVEENGTDISAIAEALLGVQASVGNVTASGLISFKAQVPAPDGLLSQIDILARATDGGTEVLSGINIQVYNSGGLKSRIVLHADQVMVTDSGGTLSAMFQGDTAYFNNARIINLQAANIGANAITATQLSANSATFAKLAINSVDETKIIIDSVSRPFELSLAFAPRSLANGATTTFATTNLNVSYSTGSFSFGGTMKVRLQSNGTPTFTIQFAAYIGSELIELSLARDYTADGNTDFTVPCPVAFVYKPASTGTQRFRMEVAVRRTGGTGSPFVSIPSGFLLAVLHQR
jgi:hypothetical protein